MASEKYFLNLACGDHFIVSSNWENVDWAPKSRDVKQIDLLKELPYPEGTFDLVYTSHFLEHIPLNQSRIFLEECRRVLKADGVLRLALPDFENIAREYIHNIDNRNFLYAEFNIIEMIDQCVRTESGGELVNWYRGVDQPDLQEYLSARTGYVIKKSAALRQTRFSRLKHITLKKLKSKAQMQIIKFIVSLFPKWYLQNHISNAVTGELHRWVYDFNSLKKILIEVNFTSVSKLDAFTSLNSDFPNIPLDVDEQGRSRKGLQSMYIEAIK
jgi:SAM-dependent methyltransferase